MSNDETESELSEKEIAEIHHNRRATDRGEVAPARVHKPVKNEDGTVSFEEVDPKEYQKQQARKFKAYTVIARIRQQLGLNQKSFADMLGIPHRTLEGLEREGANPPPAVQTLCRIATQFPELLEAIAKERESISFEESADSSRLEHSKQLKADGWEPVGIGTLFQKGEHIAVLNKAGEVKEYS